MATVKKQVLNAQDPNADPGMGRHINTDDAYPGYNGEEGGPNDIDMGGMGDYDFPDFGGGGEGFPPGSFALCPDLKAELLTY